MKQPNKTKVFNKDFFIFYIFVSIYFSLKCGEAFTMLPDTSLQFKVLMAILKSSDLITTAPFKFKLTFLAIPYFVFFMMIYGLWYLVVTSERSNYRYKEEYGSARWGNNADIEKYMDKKDFFNNIILTRTEKFRMNGEASDPKLQRNRHVLIIGGSGAGKTRYYILPNIMQMHTSYVITDPKGEILRNTGAMLEKNGYKVYVFNLIDMFKSDFYNPLQYIRNENDIVKLVNNFITNTAVEGATKGDQFWEQSEMTLLTALIAYVMTERPPERRNLVEVADIFLLGAKGKADETETEYESLLDDLFRELEEKNPDHFAVKQYNIFKSGAAKTVKSILISLGVRFTKIFTPGVRRILSMNTIDFTKLGEEKTALFILIPDTDTTYNFLAAIMYQQLFDTLFYHADHVYGGRLPVHVRFMLDEFPNIGKIPDFEKVLATMRSRNVSANIVIQGLSQLKTKYKDNWPTIVGNCDHILYLGGNETDTHKWLSEVIGKTTIDARNKSFSPGDLMSKNASLSYSTQIIGRELITPDEIQKIPRNMCIYLLANEYPFYSEKYILKEHPRYKMLAEANPNEYTYELKEKEVLGNLQYGVQMAELGKFSEELVEVLNLDDSIDIDDLLGV